MNQDVRRLFHELIGLTTHEREQVLQERAVPADLRAEVESLLVFDSMQAEGITRSVSNAAAQVLRAVNGPELTHCGSYRLVRLLGSGGMGAVYLGERTDGEIQQRVAIKLLRAGRHRGTWRERFLRERQLLASLGHPSIVRVIDAGHTEDARPYLVMEFVEGVPIDVFCSKIDIRGRLKLFLQVCEGVSHAHRRLIIHRDLKPSNILVDASGQPKLLDFGIAKLLADSGDLTQTVERLLTPKYASPEQMEGSAQTTATDIYSLGAVLYKLLTGVAPRERAATATSDIAPPSHLNPSVPIDVDSIIAKALRTEPEERYVSVDEFADDIQAALAWRPVQARAGNAWYRTRRYLRRFWMPVAATTIVMASLSAGVYVANRERAIAERGFVDVRQLSNKLFDIEYETRKLDGNTKTRQLIVDTALEYLRRSTADVNMDPETALEVGNAYMRVARVQGVPTGPNLGQMDQAEQNLKTAQGIIQSVIVSHPGNRKALLRSAQIVHDQMLLARYGGRYDEALALARRSGELLEKFNPGKDDRTDVSPILSVYSNVADQYARAEQLDEALQVCKRAENFARLAGREDYVPDLLWISSDVLRRRGDLGRAMNEVDRAVKLLEPGTHPPARWLTMNFILALIIRGETLGQDNAISLGRSAEAVESLDRAFRLADGFVHQDAVDQMVRSRMANAATVMGPILCASDPRRALEIYDHTLLHVAEIKENSSFRRFEVSLLAGSSYALQRLGRSAEGRRRLDAAFERLQTLKLYPADRIKLGSEADEALRALANYEAGNGNPRHAIEIYQELSDKIQATKPRLETSLTDAVRLSSIYRAQSALERQAGLSERADGIDAHLRSVWEQWDRKLPNNAFIARQLASTVEGPPLKR